MEFNFDSEDNIKATKTPAIKVLNNDAKFWISDENVHLCWWREDKKALIPHTLKTEQEDVTLSGYIISNPRMLILQRSLLLKLETRTGSILRAWVAGESKEHIHVCQKVHGLVCR